MNARTALIVALLAASATSFSAPVRETAKTGANADRRIATSIPDPVPYLEEELELLRRIAPWLMGEGRVRIRMFEIYTQQVIDELKDPDHGIGHERTYEAFKDQVNAIDAGKAFFDSINGEYTGENIARLLEIQTMLVEAHGFNSKAYASNIARLLTQMRVQLEALRKTAISEQLRDRIDDLAAPMGTATALAKGQGDRPRPFAAARVVSDRIKALYPEFNDIVGTKETSDMALMVRFLNERLISYGQFEEEE